MTKNDSLPPLTRDHVLAILATYQKAWENQDPDLIVTIFTPDATYLERAFDSPYQGHEGIRRYWKEKVVHQQADIHFQLLNHYIDGMTVIAEWQACFLDKIKNMRKEIKEVAILEFCNGKIVSLREYWESNQSVEHSLN